ncbi:GMC oxidoreductase [Halalkalibacter alkaliphilus]|uniref:GMC family oxidoreductase n=1 Tax=Halalkalibacter alkaliphilus TaxID=2917993 RepID=A0A9X2CUJ2_9BACI|nr:GMC oxidoreductase [Halalkalibacter alkaliphilus]MCL7748322.1 GMC family oxidoreductase [Halalkalibacter alkaliphilus]
MKILTANKGTTLRKLAHQHNVDLNQLRVHNPQIAHPDENITGRKVKIPSSPKPVTFKKSRQIENDDEQIVPTYEDCPPDPVVDYLDQWFPLTPLEEMEKIEYDAIIVGTGAGGGAALWRLCEQWRERGKRIAVLEKGGLLTPTHVANLPTASAARKFLQNPAFNIRSGEQWPEFPGAKQLYGLGGQTLLWGAVSPRYHPSDFKEWPITYDDLVTYYNIAEEVMKVTTEFVKDSNLHHTFLQRLRDSGYHDATTLPRAFDLNVSYYGKIRSNVLFSSLEFIAWALNWNGVDFAVNANVVKILHENGKATGVNVMTPDKKCYTLHGKNVIVSGSTFESPRLLLHSGIPGEAIGRYLISHSFTHASGFASREEFEEVLGITNIQLPSTNIRPYQLSVQGPFPYEFYSYQTKPLMEELEIGLWGFGTVEPRPENRVILNQTDLDSYGVPKLNVHFSYSEQDLVIIQQMVDDMIQVMDSIQLDNITLPCLHPPGFDYHAAGTCRMGNDPATSVTNEFGQVHGVSGLFVADNSVQPFMGGANPTLTTIAVAMRTADYIVGKKEE